MKKIFKITKALTSIFEKQKKGNEQSAEKKRKDHEKTETGALIKDLKKKLEEGDR